MIDTLRALNKEDNKEAGEPPEHAVPVPLRKPSRIILGDTLFVYPPAMENATLRGSPPMNS